jgi:hypothetical protein
VSTSLRRTLALLLLPTAVAVLAAPASAATPQPVAVAAPTAAPQGIIMSDGRICNPRWGC